MDSDRVVSFAVFLLIFFLRNFLCVLRVSVVNKFLLNIHGHHMALKTQRHRI